MDDATGVYHSLVGGSSEDILVFSILIYTWTVPSLFIPFHSIPPHPTPPHRQKHSPHAPPSLYPIQLPTTYRPSHLPSSLSHPIPSHPIPSHPHDTLPLLTSPSHPRWKRIYGGDGCVLALSVDVSNRRGGEEWEGGKRRGRRMGGRGRGEGGGEGRRRCY